MGSMDKILLEAWNFRHACKDFNSEKKISNEAFNIILEGGRLSPSSFGFEPWEFIVMQNQELRRKLGDLSWGGKQQISTASHVVIILARNSEEMRPESSYIQKNIMEETKHFPKEVIQAYTEKYTAFLQNDFELTLGTRACFEWVARQTYIALANMMTAAALLKIDSCPIEGFVKRDVEKFLVDNNLMNLNSFGVSSIVAFGYRAEEPPYPKTRRPQKDVVQWVL